eukprot:365264-Chlamydomonas_euryale.AAC.2
MPTSARCPLARRSANSEWRRAAAGRCRRHGHRAARLCPACACGEGQGAGRHVVLQVRVAARGRILAAVKRSIRRAATESGEQCMCASHAGRLPRMDLRWPEAAHVAARLPHMSCPLLVSMQHPRTNTRAFGGSWGAGALPTPCPPPHGPPPCRRHIVHHSAGAT